MGFTRTHEHLKVRHDVTDVPVIDYGYGNGIAQFLPDTISFTMNRYQIEPWEFGICEISGGKLRKNGIPGGVVGSRTYYSLTKKDNLMPDWARELIEHHMSELNAGRLA